jgi:hypothetical protein
MAVCWAHTALADRIDDRALEIARDVAQAELDMQAAQLRGATPKKFLGTMDADVIERAVLGDPFLYYGPDSTFAGYENADPGRLFTYLTSVWFSFPVYADGRTLGMQGVKVTDDGATRVARIVGPELPDGYELALSTAPAGPGQRVAIAQLKVGIFAIVEDGKVISAVAPLNQAARRLLGVTEDTAPSWVSPARIAPAIKAALRREREQPADGSTENAPIDDED